MINVVHKGIRKKALPRTGRTLDATEGSGSYGGSSPETGGSGGVTDHSQLIGVLSTADVYPETARDIHLTAADAKKLGSLTGLEIIKSTDLTLPTDENVYSAKRTDLEILGILIEINGMYLRKDIDETAPCVISFDRKIGSSIFLDGYEGKGWKIEPNGAAMLDSARVRSDIFIGGKFGSPSYASGFTGWGVEIDIPTASVTTDFLTVRKSMKVYELVYSQIYGLGGSHIISDLNKILRVEPLQGFYRCYMDSMDKTMRMNLRKDDIVRMQRSSGINIRYFYGEVLKVTPDYFDLKIIDGQDTPEMGDVVFRFGNKSDKNRQGIIYLTSSDDNAPYIDVLDGITDHSMFEKIKVRMGNLSGIRTKKGVQLKGYGIYAEGAVLENTDIYLQDGTTVEQQFIVMNGKFESTIEGIRNDMSLESGNILRNSSFGSNLDYWTPVNRVNFINVGGSYLWLDDAFYTEKGSVADIYRDGSKNVLRVRGTTITQKNDLFKASSKAGTYSFAFFYKVLRAGTLTVGFTGKPLLHSVALAVSAEYQKLSKVAQWDGLGDFSIAFTGEVLIYGVSLFNDALADAQIKMQTQIDQTNERILLYAKKDYVDAETGKIYIHYNSELKITAEQISAVSTRVNNINNTIATAGWITTADGNRLFASLTSVSDLTGRVSTAESSIENNAYSITQKVSSTDYNGQTIVSLVNQTASTYKIMAKNIELQGAVKFTDFDTNAQSKINNKVDSVTIIEGGKIKTSMIDTNNLTVNNVSNLGNFKVSGDVIENRTSGMTINAGGGIFFNESYNRFSRIGTRVVSAATGAKALLFLTDAETNNGYDVCTLMMLDIGRSVYPDVPQTWINCSHKEGWGSRFIVESRYLGDTDAMERTCINVGQFPSAVQLERAGLATANSWKTLLWNTVSGALGWG